ncbi:MAG: ACP S-malonyltransferase [Bacillota bacterium]|nr:ACP S-malonyltransferase [Bacillota bacterium]
MSLAFVYAGQGSQYSGMGRDLYENYPIFRSTMDAIDPGGDIKRLCFEAPMEELSQTENTQKAMVAFAVAMTETLREYGFLPAAAAGLSLGEYSALYAAGVFSASDAMDIVSFRGRVMAEAAAGVDSKMVAVLKGDIEKIKESCVAASSLGIVSVANYNCPDQVVIGGEARAVDKAVELILATGARRCVPLTVSGPFHTPIMEPAAVKMEEKLNKVKLGPMKIPVYFNVTGRKWTEGESIPQLLTEQVKSPVHFSSIIKALAEDGVDRILEIGPGKVLSGFIRKTEPKLKTYSVDSLESLEKLLLEKKGIVNE